MIKHVWFDVAGTLYRETPEFNIAHDQHRYQTYATLMGISDIEQAKAEFVELYKIHGSNSAVFTSLGQPSDYWMKAFEELDISNLLHPDPEVVNTLTCLHSIVPISVFTNLKTAKIKTLFKQLEIPIELFTHVLGGGDVSQRKPALEGFKLMVGTSGLPASQNMYIGDRIDVDIKPAKTVGMQTGLIYDASPEADYNFDPFDQIYSVLKEKL